MSCNSSMKSIGGKKKMDKKGVSVPAFFMYMNPFSRRSVKRASSKKRRGKTQKRKNKLV
uniref:Uncharacterized protein n=1 Tax=viral metagenome TaxID=1070528 RepID=A0A6C0H2Y4_9ZZZZ